MAQLESLELETDSVLLQELVEFLWLEESWSGEFLTPPGSVATSKGTPVVLGVRVVDHDLIVVGLAEGPGLLLVETVVDDGHVGIRRVSVERLTLGIVENELLISVDGWDHSGRAHGAALLGHEGLHALEVVGREKLVVIHVAVLMRVVLNALMEASEGVVEHGLVTLASNDGVKGQMHTVVDLEGTILDVLVFHVQVEGVLGATETLLLAVLMDAPQHIDALIDRLLVAVSAEEGRSHSPESNIMQLELEHG
mmetsp:Transcript_43570/g.57700  ORF Transcript_43570/g.57700 Transcript_43570/m.57700 type:complete len:253 (-) Transcript_43570:202-960(-)